MPPVGFEPTISAGEQPQTYALNRAATGNGIDLVSSWLFCNVYLLLLYGRMTGKEKWKVLSVTNLKYCPGTSHLFDLDIRT